MRLTYLSEYAVFDPDQCSGTAFWIYKGLQEASATMDHLHIDASNKLLPMHEEFWARCKNYWRHHVNHTLYSLDLMVSRAQLMASNMRPRVSGLSSDAIFTALSPLSAAYLETKIPIVYWTDATYASLAAFYPDFKSHHPETIWDAYAITHACLANASLLIFSSTWAARAATSYYGVDERKIRVIPFGANLAVSHTQADVKAMIKSRSQQCIKLLFVGKDWIRKGGDIVLTIAKALDAAGYPVELTVIGCIPDEPVLPAFVKCHGLLSKSHPASIDLLKQAYRDAHFLFMPSRAEAYGIVFCEANAFGVPCLSSRVGGIPDIIRDEVNGMTFSQQATVNQFCDYIVNLFENPASYEALALSAFHEYQTRLNWQTASRQALSDMAEIV